MTTTLELPRTFEDLTIRQLQRIAKDDVPDIQLVQRYFGYQPEQMREIPYNLIESGAEHLRKLKDNPISRHHKIIKIDGVEYGFIPHWDDLSTGEYIDLMNYSKDVIDNGAKIMSILFRPITERQGDVYTIAGYKGANGDLMAKLSASRLYGALVFFSTIQIAYKADSLRSGVKTAKETLENLGQANKPRRGFWRGMVTAGTRFWSRWRKET